MVIRPTRVFHRSAESTDDRVLERHIRRCRAHRAYAGGAHDFATPVAVRINPERTTLTTDLVDQGHRGMYRPESLATYSYGNNNPLRFVDPDGVCVCGSGAGPGPANNEL